MYCTKSRLPCATVSAAPPEGVRSEAYFGRVQRFPAPFTKMKLVVTLFIDTVFLLGILSAKTYGRCVIRVDV